MCGVTGFISFDGRPADPRLLERMMRTIEYRGPDGGGTFTDGAVGLGHRRLSIIDIAGGRQPMSFDQGALWITFNGEIFNYVELREELVGKGHTFVSQSDTEVILAAYREYGEECVTRMNGQWSLAIWDKRARTLFLSRDRMGVRPLFYSTTGDGTFVFASEAKAVLAYPGVRRELDPEALRQVFTYWFPLPSSSVFKDIKELPAGHSLIVKDGQVELKQYWQLDFSQTPQDVDDGIEQQLSDELCHLLLDATKIRLRSDVPVGAYVSGGLDSSIIAALAKRFVGSSLCTFSIAFDDASMDESSFQGDVVRSLGTNHRKIRCTSQDIGSVFEDVIWHTEVPLLRTAPVPMYLLSRLVRDSGFKVVLTGEGADEFLGGYDIFKEAKVRAFWSAEPNSKLRSQLLKRLYPYLPGLQKQSLPYLQSFFQVAKDAASHPLFSHLPRWQLTTRIQQFFSSNIRASCSGENQFSAVERSLPDSFSEWDYFSRAQFLESTLLLPQYLLSSQGDRVAMANSVEGRYPFLDYRIASLSTRIAPKLKMKVLNEKHLLKKAFGYTVPERVIRRPKQPYRAPDAASFFNFGDGSPSSDYVSHQLSAECVHANGIFDAGAVKKLVERVKHGRALGFFENAAIVGILSTQILYDKFIVNLEENLFHADRRASATVCN